MAYLTYTTEAIVCGTFNRNTADRSYLLFTREAGMLYAEAKSVREERSRQRMSLQDFSYVRVSLVKGKSSWKIGSIEPRANFFMEAVDKAARGSVVTLTKFLRRFYGGEEPLPVLFDYVKDAIALLAQETSQREQLEKIIQARMLFELGYVDVKVLPPLVLSDIASVKTATITEKVLVPLTPIIDKAVSLSHL
jgi:recombinational DNA repair protein (RecF pathway)